MVLIIIPISVYIFYYSRPIIDLIYNNQYSLASSSIQILIWTVSFLFINGAASILLNAISKERIVTKIYIVAAVFNIIVNLIFIPSFGYDGAAMATVLSEILITFLTLYYILKTDFKPDFTLLKDLLKIILCGLILIVMLYVINVSLWLAIPIISIVYLILLFVTRTIDDTDKYIIKELLNK